MQRMSAVLIALSLAACGKGSGSNEAPAGSGAPVGAEPAAPSGALTGERAAFEARRTFSTVCAVCHGPTGKGDGTAAATLDPKPRNYTDKTWQASVTDAQIRDTILKGGLAVGKSAVMPAQPQLRDQPEVLDGLVKIVRDFGK